MRKRKKAEHENHERWLVSYADFITLLFAFFVVMFASSQKDKLKARQVSQAFQEALEGGVVASKSASMLVSPGKTGAPEQIKGIEREHLLEMPDLQAPMKLLNAQLKEDIRRGTVQIRMETRGLVISLKAAAFFPSGEDDIDPSRYGTIGKVAAVLNRLPNPLRLEGHTDSLPIRTSRFRNNWELSAARSIAMLQVLNEKFGVERDRMAIVGYAETLALDSNTTERGRARNRRVDIVILSRDGLRAEPQGAAVSNEAATGDILGARQQHKKFEGK